MLFHLLDAIHHQCAWLLRVTEVKAPGKDVIGDIWRQSAQSTGALAIKSVFLNECLEFVRVASAVAVAAASTSTPTSTTPVATCRCCDCMTFTLWCRLSTARFHLPDWGAVGSVDSGPKGLVRVLEPLYWRPGIKEVGHRIIGQVLGTITS